jgi:exopolysaccharide biosynthesis protein
MGQGKIYYPEQLRKWSEVNFHEECVALEGQRSVEV